eukprot:COSAG02_NODE_28_length_51367_cov_70.053932_1_plen_45_part_00
MAVAAGGGFQVEYAKSGRASCRNTKCKGAIVSPAGGRLAPLESV